MKSTQVSPLEALSNLLHTRVERMIPAVRLDWRFPHDHKFIIEVYIKAFDDVLREGLVNLTPQPPSFNTQETLRHLATEGVDEVDELYAGLDFSVYSPLEITTSIMTFFKKHGFDGTAEISHGTPAAA